MAFEGADGTSVILPGARRYARAAATFMVVWTAMAIAFGVYNLPLAVVTLDEQGAGYCESDDHPAPCPDLLPWFAYAATASAGGWWSLAACIGLRRRRPGAGRGLGVALLTWTVALLALGALAAIEDDSSRLSGPGRELLALAVVNAGVCGVVTVLVKLGGAPLAGGLERRRGS